MNLSLEQQDILNAAKLAFEGEHNNKLNIIQISARSGSGKTSMLAAIASELKPKTGKYLAYNKSIATESKGKFSKEIECSTTHSMAYGTIVKGLGLEVGFFNYKNIREKIPFEEKILVLDIIEKFCLSSSTDIMTLTSTYKKELVEIAKTYIKKMQTKEIQCTHSFYLKLFQLSLRAGVIKPKPVDLLMLDEAGDVNEVTLDIFLNYPAKLKILVGDNHQNIYSFNGTINGFTALKGVGQYFEMTQSFRVSSLIARGVESFCQRYLDPDVKFKGIDYKPSETQSESVAFIARTNATMINRMIILDEQHMKYNLVRPVKSIFELIMILAYLKPNGEVYNAKYKFLQREANEFGEMPPAVQHQYKGLLNYIAELNEKDIEIVNAIKLIQRFSKDKIIKVYESALRHENHSSKHQVVLTTAHSSKGLEFDAVHIEDDLNSAIEEFAIDSDYSMLSEEQKEEFRLYYVAVTRCKFHLQNAKFIKC